MSRRAFSMRAARSSFVIGFARSRIEVSAAILAGRGPASAPPRPRWADTRVTDSPAAAPASESNERREIMRAPNQLENITIERRGRKGRKVRQNFFAAFAAFAFHGAASLSRTLLERRSDSYPDNPSGRESLHISHGIGPQDAGGAVFRIPVEQVRREIDEVASVLSEELGMVERV